MDNKQRTEVEAAAFRKLLAHLQKRSDVQNIDLMILSGFCRNCLSRWYLNAAKDRDIPLSDDEAREAIYGMSYTEWKSRYQQPASEEQLARYKALPPDATTE